MAEQQLNLLDLFSSVSGALTQNRQKLNSADSYNGDHGDNMVEVFSVITQAMQEKQDMPSSEQLAYASDLLRQRESGSAQVYSKSLGRAALDFQDKAMTPDNALGLVQTLLSGGETPPPPEPSNPLGEMLGGLLGGGEQQSDDSGFDAGDLLSAGMTFLQSKQQGDSDVEALVDAVVATSNMGSSTHRSQSTSLVANSLLNAIGGMIAK